MNAKQIAERLREMMQHISPNQNGEAVLAAADLLERMAWVPVSERLPELNAPVVLINIKRRWNAVFECGVTATGYLSDFGEVHWSLFGEHGATLQSYTHWRYLDPPGE